MTTVILLEVVRGSWQTYIQCRGRNDFSYWTNDGDVDTDEVILVVLSESTFARFIEGLDSLLVFLIKFGILST